MRSKAVWFFFALFVAAGVGLLILGAQPDPRQRNFECIPEMYYSPAYHYDAENPVFEDGKTLQKPAPGAVARDTQPFPFGPQPGEDPGEWTHQMHRQQRERASEHWTMPAMYRPEDPGEETELLARGEQVYETFCATCHGPNGTGDGAVTQYIPAAGIPLPDRVRTYEDGELYYIITHGSGLMGPFGGQVRPAERWKLIRYMRDAWDADVEIDVEAPEDDTPPTDDDDEVDTNDDD